MFCLFSAKDYSTYNFYFSDNKLKHKFLELIQEVSEDKKLTVFLEKRFKEYERDINYSEISQNYKDENEVSISIKF